MSFRSIHRAAFAAATLLLASTGLVAAQTRTVETTFGAVEVPDNPVRIVTTHYIATQPLVDLGITPVGQGGADPSFVIPTHWDILKDVPQVMPANEPDYEAIAGLQPDLIFEINAAPEERIARLREIAPVVIVGVTGPDRAKWQSRAHQIADAVNALDKLAVLEADFAARQAKIAADHAATIAAHPLAIVGAWAYDPGNVRLFTSASMTGSVLAPTGAVFAPGAEALANADGSDVIMSLELIGDALSDASVILYNNESSGSENVAAADLRNSDIYKLMPAAQTGHDFPIGQITIGGYGDANATLDWYVAALEALK